VVGSKKKKKVSKGDGGREGLNPITVRVLGVQRSPAKLVFFIWFRKRRDFKETAPAGWDYFVGGWGGDNREGQVARVWVV